MMNKLFKRTMVTMMSAVVALASAATATVATPITAYAATTEAHAMYYISGDVTTCAYYGTDNQEVTARRFTYWGNSACFTESGKITNSLKEKTTPCWSKDGSYLIYQETDGSATVMSFPARTTSKVADVSSVSLDSNNLFASATVSGVTVNSTNALLALANGNSGSNNSGNNSSTTPSTTPSQTTAPSLNSYVTLKDYTGTYDGKAHSITAECKVSGATISYSTDNKSFSTTNPSFTNVGNYTVYVKISAVGYSDYVGSAKVTINAATSAPSLSSYVTLSDYTGNYDGKAHSIKAECKVSGSTISYSTDGNNYSTTNPSFTNVGNYTVYVKISAVGYTDYTGTAKVTINAVSTPSLSSYVTLSDYTGTYDGKAHSVSAKCSITGASINYSSDNKTFSATNPSYTNVGNYTVYVKVTAVGYQEFNGTAKVTINAAANTDSSNNNSGNNSGDTTYNQNGNNSNYYNGDTTINNYYEQPSSSSSSSSSSSTSTTKWSVKNNAKHTSATLKKNGKKVGVLKVSGRKVIWKNKTIKLISKSQYNVGVRIKNVGFTKNGSKIVVKLNTGKKYTAKRTSPTKFSTTTKAMSFAKTGWVTLK